MPGAGWACPEEAGAAAGDVADVLAMPGEFLEVASAGRFPARGDSLQAMANRAVATATSSEEASALTADAVMSQSFF